MVHFSDAFRVVNQNYNLWVLRRFGHCPCESSDIAHSQCSVKGVSLVGDLEV